MEHRMKSLRIKHFLLLIAIESLTTLSAFSQHGPTTFVIGDTSGSMKGFVSSGSNRLTELYQLLIRNIPNARLMALSTNTVPVPANEPRYFGLASNYRGDTDLITKIKDIYDHHLSAVLVTDGMQSEGMYLDIKKYLNKMAKQGWGLWIFGLDLPFDGLIDAEELVDLGSLRSDIEQCARIYDPNAHVSIANKANRFYRYRGRRIALMFIFWDDALVGRHITQQILTNLQADPQFASTSRVVEVSPLICRGVDVVEEPVQSDESDYFEFQKPDSETSVIRSDTADGKPVKSLYLPLTWASEKPPLPQALKENPKFDIPTYTWGDSEPEPVSVQNSQDPNEVIANIKITIRSELSFWRRNFCWLPLIQCHDDKFDPLTLTVWSEFSRSGSAWWNDFSTDNSWQCPAKVYKLSTLINEVSEVAASQLIRSHPPKTFVFKLIVGPL
jgi:hypothetical protein